MAQMIIVLCKVPRYHETYFEENSESLALASLAAYLRGNGCEVIIFDASLEKMTLKEAKERVLQIIEDHSVLLVGFTIADMTFIESTIETINFLRENGVRSHITMGGHAPTFNFEEVLSMCPGLDSIIGYEGERALLNLIESLRNNTNWQTCPNVAYKKNGADFTMNPPLPLIADLDELPFPARDYLPYVLSELKETGVVPVAASRGCYRNCGFCSINNFYGPPEGRLWRSRSIGNLICEIKILKETFPFVREIVIVDDIFSGPPRKRVERMLELREGLQRNNLRLMFSVSERVDTISEEIAKLWRDIGVRQVLVGLESASQEILDKLRKGITLDHHKKALFILDKYEIDSTISFINFTPWSTLEQIEENVSYFLQLKVNLIQGMLNRFQIYDGTFLANELKREGLVHGTFPNQHYRTLDERVDNLYQIIEKNLNPYLFIAYQLKILERELRIALFDAETDGDNDQIIRVNKYRIMYKNMMQMIMDEAVSQFLTVLELLKSGVKTDEYFFKNVKEKVLGKSNEWYKMIKVFKALCPVLNLSYEKGPIYAATGQLIDN
jgi:radical SAM superfamily enzyme YgiQ (UPF0313 family)